MLRMAVRNPPSQGCRKCLHVQAAWASAAHLVETGSGRRGGPPCPTKRCWCRLRARAQCPPAARCSCTWPHTMRPRARSTAAAGSRRSRGCPPSTTSRAPPRCACEQSRRAPPSPTSGSSAVRAALQGMPESDVGQVSPCSAEGGELGLCAGVHGHGGCVSEPVWDTG